MSNMILPVIVPVSSPEPCRACPCAKCKCECHGTGELPPYTIIGVYVGVGIFALGAIGSVALDAWGGTGINWFSPPKELVRGWLIGIFAPPIIGFIADVFRKDGAK